MKPLFYQMSLLFIFIISCFTSSKTTVMDEATMARYRNAQNFVTQGQYWNALTIYNEILQQYSENAQVYNARGLVYEKLKQYQNALNDYNRAIQLAPNTASFYYDRAIVHFTLKNNTLSFQDIDHAISLNPNEAKFFLLKALMYKNLKQYVAATKEFMALANRFPSFKAKGYFEIGQMFLALRDYQRAIPVYGNAITYYKDMAKTDSSYRKSVGVTYNQRGVCYYRSGSYNPSLMDFLMAVIYAPREGLYQANVGEAYIKLGNYEKALQWAKTACRNNNCTLLRTLEKQKGITPPVTDRKPDTPIQPQPPTDNKKGLDKSDLRDLFKSE